VRYNILAMRLGLSLEEWQKPFEHKDDDGSVYGLDAWKTHEWFEENARKFPDEFNGFLMSIKKIHGIKKN